MEINFLSRFEVLRCAGPIVVAMLVSCAGEMGPAGERGDEGAKGEPGDPGSSGETGLSGEDGSIRIYGDGSAGAHVVSGNEDWLSSPPSNLQFTDFTIEAGGNLMVPSGTVIRVTGTFTNRGTIAAVEGAVGGWGYLTAGVSEKGIATTAATFGETGPDTEAAGGGAGGRGMRELQARSILSPGILAGGGGGASGVNGVGGDGGASFTVLAGGAILNGVDATIEASGMDTLSGGGGGGGGVIILASRNSVTNEGTLNAKGGGGSFSSFDSGAGGGGGGGIIHLIAPVAALGTINVGGGLGGTNEMTVGGNPRAGGGGGGGSAGFGGGGGYVQADGTAHPGQPGSEGFGLLTLADPSALF
jgi:hypothetical protein